MIKKWSIVLLSVGLLLVGSACSSDSDHKNQENHEHH
ncbi:hypothetical protein C8J48_1348 [Desmospora activa DSM 45169]|uniref:Lipoprotein n=1 Tax=Desmospora activa DSM 45169 TaxID=1121389 RepID=A0A2T4ZA38_9BACL|nr:hypothetical protein C8J48_1348 [Desmospora activa DSM 45169]